MSTKTVEVRVDDMDGTVLVDKGAHTKIVLDGEVAELDLTEENYNTLRETLAPYFRAAHGNMAGGQKSSTSNRRTVAQSGGTSNQKTTTTREGLKAIREWASKNGYKVSERGRIPYSVMDAYAKTHIGA
jgi:hypothetical protein